MRGRTLVRSFREGRALAGDVHEGVQTNAAREYTNSDHPVRVSRYGSETIRHATGCAHGEHPSNSPLQRPGPPVDSPRGRCCGIDETEEKPRPAATRITMMRTQRRVRATTATGPVKIQRGLAVMRPEPEGVCAIQVSHRAGRKRGTGRISPRYLLRCGCCERKLEIYYDAEGLEINGVNGSLEN